MISLIPVAPNGSTKSVAHINRGDRPHEWREVERSTFPANRLCEIAKTIRLGLRLGQGEVARAVGLRVTDITDIERRRSAFASDADFVAYVEALAVLSRDVAVGRRDAFRADIERILEER